ncbi:MAG: apolipoprotein N-acyltransferase [Spirochaetales bacterium]|nr:apolipoprotein N-acyltransferase [Spirochaetales bacterium]
MLAALCFALSFPSFLSVDGWGMLGFVALCPLFIVVHRSGWVRVFIYGALFGFACYAISNFWLATFHPLAIFVVPVIYAAYFFVFLPILKLIDTLFPDYGYILQAIAWVAYEYLRTQGYLGYAYGILGYTQYQFLPLARCASITGIWGVTLMVIFPSALLGNGLKNGFSSFLPFLKKMIPVLSVYGIVFSVCVVYGACDTVDNKGAGILRAALIQQNNDPWKNDYDAYEETLDKLIVLSTKALNEKPEMIIWSETAFVPAIDYHFRYRENREAYIVVKKLLDFLETQTIPYVIGNDDGRKATVMTPGGNLGERRVDYNAAILFRGAEIVDIYRKIHLVPFAEHFPYEDILPWMYRMLIEADTHFWEKGTEYTVFEAAGVKFSTPICFEDTFGYLCRRFVRHGAGILVNMTNDSWSGSVVSEVQHMAMAVFRAIENKRSLVRATNSGITCMITPDGEIKNRLEPFTEDYVVVDVPVYTETTTLYNEWEDWFAIVALIAAIALILAGFVKIAIIKLNND